MDHRSPLYLLEAYGLSPWLLWRIRRGALDEVCARCGGAGVVIDSPCRYRETIDPATGGPTCDREVGCERCRRECPACRGRRTLDAGIHAEDFGDEVSRDLARLLDPEIEVDYRPRTDREPRALGGR